MAAPQMPARDMTSVFSALLDETETEVRSQVFEKTPVLNMLWKNRKPGSGGDDVHRWPVYAGLNPNFKSMSSDADTVTWTETQTVTTAWWDSMALLAVPLLTSVIREAKLKGKAAIIDLAKWEAKQAAHTIRRGMSSQTFGDGSTPGTLIGLEGILPHSGVGTNTVYNIPEVSNRFWRNLYFANVGNWSVHGIGGTTDDVILLGYLSCSDNGAMTPDLFICDITTVLAYSRAETRTRQTTTRAELGNIARGAAVESNEGAWLPMYGMKVVWDVAVPTGYAYMVHSEDFSMIEDPALNMKWIGPLQGMSQPLLHGRVLFWRGQTQCYRRNWNAKFTGIVNA